MSPSRENRVRIHVTLYMKECIQIKDDSFLLCSMTKLLLALGYSGTLRNFLLKKKKERKHLSSALRKASKEKL